MHAHHTTAVVDLTNLCPKCGQSSQCAVANGEDARNCWCMAVTLDERVLQDVENQGRCLCASCATENAVSSE